MVVIWRNEDWLEHHGINGQKWGKKNGPPYPLDYEDHSAAQKKANPKSELNNYENNNATAKTEAQNKKEKKQTEKKQEESSKSDRLSSLMQRGMSEEEAKSQIKFEKRAIAIATVTAAAIGAGVAYNLVKHHDINSDFTLHAGTNIYRVATSDNPSVHDMFYAATNKADSKKYAGMYAKQLNGSLMGNYNGKDIYQKILSPDSDIKIAGAKTGEKIFNELKKDPKFLEALMPEQSFPDADMRDIRQRAKNISYDMFNKGNIVIEKNTRSVKMFFDALQKEGYGGIIDVNDSKYSGYESNKPVILFNQQSNIKVNSVEKLSRQKIDENFNFARKRILAQNLIANTPVYTLTVASLGSMAIVKTGKSYLTSLESGNTSDNASNDKETKKK